MKQQASIPFVVQGARHQARSLWTDDLTSEEPLPASVGATAGKASQGTRVTMVDDETTDDE
jgi:hypothetical protein